MSQQADPVLFVNRFENLKKKWFSNELDSKYDDEGQEIPSALTREQVAGMFEKMGVEIPVMPDEPPVPKGQRGSHIGMWWKK